MVHGVVLLVTVDVGLPGGLCLVGGGQGWYTIAGFESAGVLNLPHPVGRLVRVVDSAQKEQWTADLPVVSHNRCRHRVRFRILGVVEHLEKRGVVVEDVLEAEAMVSDFCRSCVDSS